MSLALFHGPILVLNLRDSDVACLTSAERVILFHGLFTNCALAWLPQWVYCGLDHNKDLSFLMRVRSFPFFPQGQTQNIERGDYTE